MIRSISSTSSLLHSARKSRRRPYKIMDLSSWGNGMHMQTRRMIASAILAAGLVALYGALAIAGDEKQPAGAPAAQVKNAAGDAPPPRDRAGRPPDGKNPGKPDDNDEGSAGFGGPGGGPGDGPGGPGRRP